MQTKLSCLRCAAAPTGLSSEIRNHLPDPEPPSVPFSTPAALNPELLPDYLVISPPKTGSTWLAANLNCHPGLFVPALKELKYFSSYRRWLDLDWYVRQFAEAGGRVKGEASPSYALLPQRMIRHIRALMPHVKLIFLMRDPVARAWSHAKHNYHYREANFLGHAGDLHAVADKAWRANFRHPWPLLSGDYLGQLRRWLSVFPPEQIFVDYYERIATDPVGLLQRVFAFLGVPSAVDWGSFRTDETILPGAEKPLAGPLRRDLRALLRDRTEDLDVLLRERFGLSVRAAWGETLGPEAAAEAHPDASAAADAAAMFARGCDDRYLAAVLQTEMDSALPQLVEEGYHGYNLVLHRGRVLALWQGLGPMDLGRLDEAVAGRPGAPEVAIADSLQGAREAVVWHVIRRLRETQASQEARRGVLEGRLAECEAMIARLRRSSLGRGARAVARWLRRWIGRRADQG